MIDLRVLKIQGQELSNNDMRASDLLSLLNIDLDKGISLNRQVETLKTLAGVTRLEKIFERQGKDFDALNAGQMTNQKKMIHQILVGMKDIRLEDIQEIGGTNATTEVLDKLYNTLLPPKIIRDLFSDYSKELSYYDKATSFGAQFAAIEQRVSAILLHKAQIETNSLSPSNAAFEDLELLSSRLADREPPVGTLVRLSTGYFAADKIFIGGGAFITLWQSVSNDRPPIIVCRGTAFRPGATSALMSGVNDLLPEVGFYGIRSVWPEIKEYLDDKEICFVEVYGKSLGGAHAQYLTTLITGLTETTVSILKTNCSLGTPESVHTNFNDALKNTKKNSPLIEVYRNIGNQDLGEVDFVPLLGGYHLHVPEKTRVIYVLPQESIQKELSENEGKTKDEVKRAWVKAFHAPRDFAQNLKGLFQSFHKAHPRQNSLKSYTLVETKNAELEVKVGTRLEAFRSNLAAIFNACTFYTFQKETFEEFYSNQTNK